MTEAGQQVFAQHQQLWQKGINDLLPEQQQGLLQNLNQLLLSMQQANNNKVFGVCQSCKHLLVNAEKYTCGLTQQALEVDELALICTFHTLND